MLNQDIKQWLTEFKSLPSSEIGNFASTLSSNEDLIISLFELFETPPFQVQHLDPVCHQLYEFYRSKEKPLQTFSLQFVPTLIWLYLSSISQGNKKVCGGVETFLLGVYNLEIVNVDGSPVVETFRIPMFGKPSIYHDARSSSLGMESSLTESALRQLNNSHCLWKGGPFPSHEHFNAQNRFSILAVVMQHYNRQIDVFNQASLTAVCKAVTNLVNSGFGSKEWSQVPRMTVHPSLLVEMLASVFFAMFNDHQQMAVQAIQATHKRASYELYSDVLLMTNSLLNSIHNGNFQVKKDETAAVPAKLQTGKRSSITNASFKAKKLPDDIDYVEEDDNGGNKHLATVDEDSEHSMAKNIKAKLMNIGGKLGGGGDKNKNKDSGARRDSDAMSQKSGGGPPDAAMESLNVAVVKSGHSGGSGGGKVVVDVLEMQPIKGGKSSKHHRHDHHHHHHHHHNHPQEEDEEAGIDMLDNEPGLEQLTLSRRNHGNHDNTNNEGAGGGKSSGGTRTSASSLVFSKKLGFTKSSPSSSSSPSATATSSPTSGPASNDGGANNNSSRKNFLYAAEAKPGVAPTLPETINASANGISNSSSSGVSSSSSSVVPSPARCKSEVYTSHRASSEGRTLDGAPNSLGFGGGVSSSGKQFRIATSISESNLPPSSSADPPSSQSSYSVSSDSGSHKTKGDKKGFAGQINPSSYSTNL